MCATDADCGSGFCADGWCCDLACDAVCEACNLAGSEGACAFIPPGEDPADECPGADACNGAGACGPETQDITVVESLPNIGEGSSGTFTVRLALEPIADTTAFTVAPTNLTFTPANYDAPQTVTVSGVADVDIVHEAVTITIASAPLPDKTFTVNQYDDDLLYDPPNQSGGCFTNDTISMRLLAAPLGSVVVTASITGGTAGDAIIFPSSRTFTTANWATFQTFTVTYGEVGGTTSIELSAPGQTTRTVVVTASGIDCL